MADVWSCGVMLFIMLAAAYPFGRPEDEQLKPTKKMHVMLQVKHTSTFSAFHSVIGNTLRTNHTMSVFLKSKSNVLLYC